MGYILARRARDETAGLSSSPDSTPKIWPPAAPKTAAPPAARCPSPARRALATADIRLVRWSPARMRARLGEVIAVYKAAFLDVHEADPVRAARDRMAHARRHTERRDLRVVA